MDFLSEIIVRKRLHIEAAKRAVPIERIREMAEGARIGAKHHAFVVALSNNGLVNIIAEFKRRSPSKGVIRANADAATMARSYESAGAAAISVLTEENFFDGSLDDLHAVREAVSIPILRKDFIVDEYQVYESAAAGADALLLIVAALDDETLARLRLLVEVELGMDALVEVHTEKDLARAIASGAKLVGVNNRDLRTFDVSTETSMQLARLAPVNALLVSESGLSPEEVSKLRGVGYKGFLVGEALMRADDPERQLRTFKGKSKG
jgi:indole-3-glycerol phosphate synthase